MRNPCLLLKRPTRLRTGGGSTSLKALAHKIGDEMRSGGAGADKSPRLLGGASSRLGGGGGFKTLHLVGGASSRFPNRPDGKGSTIKAVRFGKRLTLL